MARRTSSSDDAAPQAQLPASIEMAWGVRDRASRGPKPALRLESVVDAGCRVAETEGIDAVSMGRVAAELGVSTMSLYRYVAAKGELLALMVDAAYGLPPPPTAYRDWRSGMREWACHERAAIMAHPWVLKVPIVGPPVTPNQMAWLEAGLTSLAATSLSEADKMSTILLVSSFVRAEAVLAVEIATAAATAGSAPGDLAPAYRRMLTRLAAREKFPALYRVIDAGVLDADDEPGEEFDFGIDRILDGIRLLVEGGTSRPRRSRPTG